MRQPFLERNLEAARVILEDVPKHGGESAGLVAWARLVPERAQPAVKGPPFRAA
jgi:hypothetical protein